jgi:hypothetical protein
VGDQNSLKCKRPAFVQELANIKNVKKPQSRELGPSVSHFHMR